MTIITDSSELTINICSSILHKKTSILKTNSPTITFGLFKSREFIGIGDISISPDPQWVSLRSQNKSQKKNLKTHNLAESLKLKIRCCYTKDIKPQTTNNNNIIKTMIRNQASLPIVHANSIDSKHKKANSLNANMSTPIHKKQISKVGSFPLSSSTATKSSKNVVNSYKEKKSPTQSSVTTNQNSSLLYHNNSYQNNIGLKNSDSKQYYTNKSEKKIGTKKKKSSLVQEISQKQISSTKMLPNTLLSTIEKKELEEHIIDKSYENGIKNDEMIDDETTNKSWVSYNRNDESFFLLFNDEREEKNIEKFYDLKDDYDLMYSDDYVKNIEDKMFKLELELAIEKSLELQRSFYDVYFGLSEKNKKIQNFIQNYNSKIIQVIKNTNKLEILNQKLKYKGDLKLLHTNPNITREKENYIIWKNFLNSIKKNEKGDFSKKKKLKSIMKVVIKNRKAKENFSLTERNKMKLIVNESLCNTNDKVNGGIKSPLMSEHINSLKMKLLPLISENNIDGQKENCIKTSVNTNTNNALVKNNAKKRPKSKPRSTKYY